MGRVVAYAAGLALVLNALAALGQFSYQWSVTLVFGGMVLFFVKNAWGLLSSDNWKLFWGLFLFSNVCTLGLEVLMLHFQVWGFSDRVYHLMGYTIFGAPIEEYEYWAACAAIVPLAYLVFGKALASPVKENPLLLAKLVDFASHLHLQAKTDKNTYVEADDKPGQFEEGSKFPVYVCVQLAILACIIALVRLYHGNWKALLSTVLVFFLTAFPNEYYSIHQGYWLYNSQRMIGVFILHIPLEGWLMYFLPAVLACFMLDVANRKFFGKDV